MTKQSTFWRQKALFLVPVVLFLFGLFLIGAPTKAITARDVLIKVPGVESTIYYLSSEGRRYVFPWKRACTFVETQRIFFEKRSMNLRSRKNTHAGWMSNSWISHTISGFSCFSSSSQPPIHPILELQFTRRCFGLHWDISFFIWRLAIKQSRMNRIQ